MINVLFKWKDKAKGYATNHIIIYKRQDSYLIIMEGILDNVLRGIHITCDFIDLHNIKKLNMTTDIISSMYFSSGKQNYTFTLRDENVKKLKSTDYSEYHNPKKVLCYQYTAEFVEIKGDTIDVEHKTKSKRTHT